MFFAGLWGVFDLIPNNAHEKELRAIQRAQTQKKEIKSSRVDEKLNSLSDEDYNGTVLGISKTNGQKVVLPDSYVNQIVLVLGTTGVGKAVTLRRFYARAATTESPLIIVDGKPTDESVKWLEELASNYGRKFYGFNCGNYCHYDCLKQGGYTELKDKIITLKDEWESEYYRSIADDLTSQIDTGSATGLGSARRNKTFIVHPDDIKQNLQVGEAFYIIKVKGFYQDKIKIKYS